MSAAAGKSDSEAETHSQSGARAKHLNDIERGYRKRQKSSSGRSASLSFEKRRLAATMSPLECLRSERRGETDGMRAPSFLPSFSGSEKEKDKNRVRSNLWTTADSTRGCVNQLSPTVLLFVLFSHGADKGELRAFLLTRLPNRPRIAHSTGTAYKRRKSHLYSAPEVHIATHIALASAGAFVRKKGLCQRVKGAVCLASSLPNFYEPSFPLPRQHLRGLQKERKSTEEPSQSRRGNLWHRKNTWQLLQVEQTNSVKDECKHGSLRPN